MSKVKIIIIALCAIVFLFGACLFLYPEYLKYGFKRDVERKKTEFLKICENNISQSDMVTDNAAVVGTDEEEHTEQASQPISQTTPRYEELYKAMQLYNQELYANNQYRLVDEYSYVKPELLLSDYDIYNGEILGFIEIPSVDVDLPIINGASYENMLNGAVYLVNTSFPIGGENTNCVIAAHNQWKGVYMFMRITELEKGDKVYITNLWETLEYSVSDTKIIEPDDSNEIMIKSGKDMVTLSTCFYTSDGKKRFIVFAERCS